MSAVNKVSIYTLTAASSVLLGAIAHADSLALFARGGNAGITGRHDNRAQGVVLRHPERHWTARIGTGAAATFEQGGNDSKTLHDGLYAHGKAVNRPEAHWTSRIGVGTAASLED